MVKLMQKNGDLLKHLLQAHQISVFSAKSRVRFDSYFDTINATFVNLATFVWLQVTAGKAKEKIL